MPTNSPKRRVPKPKSSVIRWLLDSDPSIRWQTMRDLTDAPDEEVAAERAKIATEGWGAELLAHQGADGFWGMGTPNPEWVTLQTLLLLCEMGLDPTSEQARRAVDRVGDNVTWQGVLPQDAAWHGKPLFAGEVEPCINGRVGVTPDDLCPRSPLDGCTRAGILLQAALSGSRDRFSLP